MAWSCRRAASSLRDALARRLAGKSGCVAGLFSTCLSDSALSAVTAAMSSRWSPWAACTWSLGALQGGMHCCGWLWSETSPKQTEARRSHGSGPPACWGSDWEWRVRNHRCLVRNVMSAMYVRLESPPKRSARCGGAWSGASGSPRPSPHLPTGRLRTHRWALGRRPGAVR